MGRFRLVLMVLSACFACRPSSLPEVWIIPEGYVGWLRLDYAVAGAPPLPIEGGHYVVRLTRTGRLFTSSENSSPLKYNEYDYETPVGRHKLVSISSMVPEHAVQNAFSFGKGKLNSGFPRPQAECVFVGTGLEFKSNGRDCMAWQPGDPQPPRFAKRTAKP